MNHSEYMRVDESRDFLKVVSLTNIATILRHRGHAGVGWEVTITYFGGATVSLRDEEFKKFWNTVKHDVALSYGGDF